MGNEAECRGRLRFRFGLSDMKAKMVQTQSAIQRVTPPTRRESKEPGPAVEVETPKPRSRLARLVPNQAQWYLLGQAAAMGLAGFLLPRYGTTLITDIIWGTFEACLLTFVYQRVGAIPSFRKVLTDLVRAYPACFLCQRCCATGIRKILIATCSFLKKVPKRIYPTSRRTVRVSDWRYHVRSSHYSPWRPGIIMRWRWSPQLGS
jgi:hypothetical protein